MLDCLIYSVNYFIKELLENRLKGYDPLTFLPALDLMRLNPNDASLAIGWHTLLKESEYLDWVEEYFPRLEVVDECIESQKAFLVNEPSRRNDWFDCIKDHALNFYNKHNKIPLESQLWSQMYNSGLPEWSLVVDKKKGQIELGGKPLDRETFKKRYKDYFPADNGE